MRIALINPPQPELFDADAYPALGLLYLAGVLEAAGHDVVYVRADEAAYDLPEADAYLVTATTALRPAALDVLARARAAQPRARLVVGGVDPTIDPKPWLGAADAVVRGEAERAIVDVVEGRRSGVVEAGTLTDERGSEDRALDWAPIPPRRLIRPDRSGVVASGRRGVAATTVSTSRGCPYSCTFCTRIDMTKKVRYHSVERVREEFAYLYDSGFTFLRVVDDMFALWERRVVELCQSLAADRRPFHWLAITRADKLTQPMAEAMRAGGCQEVHFGVETGSARLMREVRKAENPEDVVRGTAIAKAAGLMVKWFLIADLPTETAEDIEATKALVLRCRPDKTTVSEFTPIPGSELFQRCINDLPGRGYFYSDHEPELKRWVREEYLPTLGHDQATANMRNARDEVAA